MSQRFRTHTPSRRHTIGLEVVRRRNFLTRPLGLECLEDRRLLAAFQADSVVVYRVGDGVTALGTTAAAIYLDEYSPTGTLRQSLPLPSSTISASNDISEGFLSRSTDGKQLILPGYYAPVGTPGIKATTSATTPRMLGRVGGTGTFQVAAATTQWFSANSIRSAASPDGNTLYAAGAGNGSSGGVWVAQFGDATATRINNTATAVRNVAIFQNQLFATASTGTRLGKVGVGLPVDTGQLLTQLNTLPATPTTGYGYFFADLDVAVAGDDTLYITDDAGGKVTKYSSINETWTDKGSVTFGVGVRGLTGSVSGGAVTLYATSSNGNLSELRKLTDSSGFEGTFAGSTTLLATANSASMAFRGVALAPLVPNASPVYDASGDTSLTTQAQNAANNSGDTITALIASAGAGRITDADASALQGLAIVAADAAGGAWQYSLDGSTWLALGAVSDASARLLPADGVARIRLVPNGAYSGTKSAALQVRAWDRTQGSAGGLLDTAGKIGSGGSLSTTVEDVSLRINQTPTLTAISDQTIDEDGATAALEFTMSDDDAISSLELTVLSDNPTLLPVDRIAITGSGATRTLIAAPLANGFGAATITLQISDGLSTSQRSFTLTVRSVNDLPTIAQVAAQQIDEDGSLVDLPLLVGDLEDGGAVTVTVSSNNPQLIAAGGLQLGGDGANRTLTIHPIANAYGAATITLLVTDGNGGTASTSFALTVDSINDAPVIATIGSQQTDEDQPLLALALALSDVETTSDQLQVTAVSNNEQLFPTGSLVIVDVSGTYQLSAIPAANLFGTATITVSVTDGAGASRSASFTLVVSPVNDPPTLQPLAARTIDEDGALGPLMLSVDDLETPVELTLAAATDNDALFPPAGISLALVNNAWQLTLTPAANESGEALVTVTVSDPSGASFVRTFVATVSPVNDRPEIAPIATQSTNEDTPLIGIALDFSDIETLPADLILSASSNDGALFPAGSLTFVEVNGQRTLTLAPTANLSGTTTITVVVSDPAGASNSATFTIVVQPVNDPPTLAAIGPQTIDEDNSFGPLLLPVSDIESLTELTIVATADDPLLFVPGSLTAVFANGEWRLSGQPASNLFGTTQVTVVVTDPAGDTASQAFSLTVRAVNDPPTIATIADQSTDEDTPLAGVALDFSDLESLPADLILTVSASNDTLFPTDSLAFAEVNGQRTLRLAPAAGLSGSANITVVVADPAEASNSATFTIVVVPINDPPTLAAIGPQTIDEDNSFGPLLLPVNDIESLAELTIVATADDPLLFAPGSLTAVFANGEWRLSGQPANNRFGTTQVTVLVTDPAGDTASQTFLLTVSAVNDLPTIVTIADQSTDEDTPLAGIELALVDVETSTAELTLTAASDNDALFPAGSFSFVAVNGVRALRVAPAADRSGAANITVTVTDAAGASSSATFAIVVHSVNDLPTVGAIANQTIDEDQPLGPVLLSVSDAESIATVAATSDNEALLPSDSFNVTRINGQWQLTAASTGNQSGTAHVTVTVTDSDGATASQTFTVTVNAVNDPPTIEALADQTVGEDRFIFIGVNASDLETSANGLTVTAAADDPILFPAGSLTLSLVDGVRLLRLKPAADRSGAAIVTVTVTDEAGAWASAAFTVTVSPENDPPTLAPLVDQTIDEDGALGPVTLLPDDKDTPSQLTLTAESDNPALVPNEQIAVALVNNRWQLSLSPVADASGSATITVFVTDPSGASSFQQFTLVVTPVNDLPTISVIANQSLDEDTSLDIPFAISDRETPREALSVTAVAEDDTLFRPGGVTVATNADGGVLHLRPVANRFGTTVVTVTVTDEAGAATSTQFTVVVRPVDDPLEVGDVRLTAVQATPATGQLSASDTDGRGLRFSVGSLPQRGTVTITNFATGEFVYRPRPLSLGADSFVYLVSDGVTTRQGVVTIDIERPRVLVSFAGGILGVTSSPAADTIIIAPAGPGQLFVVANGRVEGPFPVAGVSLVIAADEPGDIVFVHQGIFPPDSIRGAGEGDSEAEQYLPSIDRAAHDAALLELISFWNSTTTPRRRGAAAG